MDDESARRVLALGNDAAIALTLAVNAHVLEQDRRLAELDSKQSPGPHASSVSIRPYAKAGAPKRGRSRPGAREGHDGHRRPTPKPDERVEVDELTTCPDCDGEVHPTTHRRTRTVEDMPE